MLRYFAGVMAWVTLLSVNLFFAAFTLLCATRAGLVGDNAVGKVTSSPHVAAQRSVYGAGGELKFRI